MKKNINKIILSAFALSSLLACSAYSMQDQAMQNQGDQDKPDPAKLNDWLCKLCLERRASALSARPIECLLKKGANPHAVCADGTPVFVKSAGLENTHVIRAFLSHRFQPQLVEQNGHSTLISTAHLNDPGIIQALLDIGANIHAANQNGTALHRAADSLADKTAEILVANGADTDILNQNGQRPLDVAYAKLKKIQDGGRARFADSRRYDDALAKTQEIINLLERTQESKHE